MFSVWEEIRSCPGNVLYAGGIRSRPENVLYAGENENILWLCLQARGDAEKIKNCEIGSDVRLCYTGIKSFTGEANV